MIEKFLLTDTELAARLGTGFKRRTIKTLRITRKIPFVKVGHRTIRYNFDNVKAALQRLETQAESTRRRGRAR
jgi:excisionase family DNA binding protein